MKWSIAAVLASVAFTGSSAFVANGNKSLSFLYNQKSHEVQSEINNAMAFSKRTNEMQMVSVETETDYDVVTVDLADGRDYPIYIGSNFSEEEGRSYFDMNAL